MAMLNSLLGVFGGRAARTRAALRDFRRAVASLTPASVAIDCGANVGLFTEEMAASGATVWAFEPNEHAFAELQRRTARFPSVTCLRKAVADRPGEVRLFLHENAAQDPLKWSTGSSILAYKANVRASEYQTVEAVSLVGFLEGLSRPVDLIKLDVEGAEVAILESLIDAGLHRRVGQIFAEVHDRKVPELVTPTNALRVRLRKERIANINLDWQ
jgi:FkbM family methyltransferase